MNPVRNRERRAQQKEIKGNQSRPYQRGPKSIKQSSKILKEGFLTYKANNSNRIV